MCGIAGIFGLGGAAASADPAATARIMADTLAHRGPDGADSWGDPEAGIGLGHRRLSIIDLSIPARSRCTPPAAATSSAITARSTISASCAKSLEPRGHAFRGTSDTEVMLAAISEWGIEKAVQRFVGMFAFAVFDRQARTLHLVRDRLGIKPLYWTLTEGLLLFGSELRALMAHPAFRAEIDREAASAFLRYSYVPAPSTIFRNVHKLPPGSILTIGPGREPSIEAYWRLRDVIVRPPRRRFVCRRSRRPTRRPAARGGARPHDRGCADWRLSLRRRRFRQPSSR